MEKDKAPKPPAVGIVYGEIVYWLLLIGMIIAIVGSAIYMGSEGYANKTSLLENLWEGVDARTIWEESAGATETPEGHWYFCKLSQGDGIAMLGIAIGSLAAVFGMWGAFVVMLRSKERLYLVLSLIIAVILTLSALGILSLEH